MVNPSKNPKNARNVSLWPTSNIPQTGKKNVREQTHSHPYTEGMQYTHFCSKKRPSFFGERPHFPQILLPPQHSKGPRCHPGDPGDTDLEKMGWIPSHLGRHPWLWQIRETVQKLVTPSYLKHWLKASFGGIISSSRCIAIPHLPAPCFRSLSGPGPPGAKNIW